MKASIPPASATELKLGLERLPDAMDEAQLASVLDAVHAALLAYLRNWLDEQARLGAGPTAADLLDKELLFKAAECAPLGDGVGDLLHAAQRFEGVRERFKRTGEFAAEKGDLVRYARLVVRALETGLERTPALSPDAEVWSAPIARLVVRPPLLLALSALAVSIGWFVLLMREYVRAPRLHGPSVCLIGLLIALCYVLAAEVDPRQLWRRGSAARSALRSARAFATKDDDNAR